MMADTVQSSQTRTVEKSTDRIDKLLESVGHYRKQIAKDGNCICRILSEEIYYTQCQYEKVRTIVARILGIEDASAVNSELIVRRDNLTAVALEFKFDFILWEPDSPHGHRLTNLGFNKTISICAAGPGCYDHVITKGKLENLAFAQSIVYDILFTNVFGIANAKTTAVRMLESSVEPPDGEEEDSEIPVQSDSAPIIGDSLEIFRHGGTPFPYRAAKALHPKIFRNVEFDVWMASKKSKKFHATKFFNAILQVGTKCLVSLDGRNLTAHIQSMESRSPHSLVDVFVQELGERKLVPFSCLRLIPIEEIAKEATIISKQRMKGILPAESEELAVAKLLDSAIEERENTKEGSNEFPVIEPWVGSGLTEQLALPSSGLQEKHPFYSSIVYPDGSMTVPLYQTGVIYTCPNTSFQETNRVSLHSPRYLPHAAIEPSQSAAVKLLYPQVENYSNGATAHDLTNPLRLVQDVRQPVMPQVYQEMERFFGPQDPNSVLGFLRDPVSIPQTYPHTNSFPCAQNAAGVLGLVRETQYPCLGSDVNVWGNRDECKAPYWPQREIPFGNTGEVKLPDMRVPPPLPLVPAAAAMIDESVSAHQFGSLFSPAHSPAIGSGIPLPRIDPSLPATAPFHPQFITHTQYPASAFYSPYSPLSNSFRDGHL